MLNLAKDATADINDALKEVTECQVHRVAAVVVVVAAVIVVVAQADTAAGIKCLIKVLFLVVVAVGVVVEFIYERWIPDDGCFAMVPKTSWE